MDNRRHGTVSHHHLMQLLFIHTGFVRSRPRGTERFFQLLTKTQLFSHFIESRSLSSNNDDVLAFFDECCERVREENILIGENILSGEKLMKITIISWLNFLCYFWEGLKSLTSQNIYYVKRETCRPFWFLKLSAPYWTNFSQWIVFVRLWFSIVF